MARKRQLREREREREAGRALLASDRLAGSLSAGQGERERGGRNDAEIALTASQWLVAWPFTCVLLASPPVRFDAGMLVCSLASSWLQRQESGVIEREGERHSSRI
jgi:hypothetical protein